ncbi:MAG TPA: hypothetical protein VGB30_02455 [bacterium]|jgi:hypothetical protein
MTNGANPLRAIATTFFFIVTIGIIFLSLSCVIDGTPPDLTKGPGYIDPEDLPTATEIHEGLQSDDPRKVADALQWVHSYPDDSRIIELLIDLYESENSEYKWDALGGLRSIGNNAEPHVIKLLDVPAYRIDVLQSLAYYQYPTDETVQKVFEAGSVDDVNVRTEVLRCIMIWHKYDHDLSEIIASLIEEDSDTENSDAWTLGWRASEEFNFSSDRIFGAYSTQIHTYGTQFPLYGAYDSLLKISPVPGNILAMMIDRFDELRFQEKIRAAGIIYNSDPGQTAYLQFLVEKLDSGDEWGVPAVIKVLAEVDELPDEVFMNFPDYAYDRLTGMAENEGEREARAELRALRERIDEIRKPESPSEKVE